ncbi:MAG: carbamoyltransferase C-terminal domain-containing protein [Candidatus Promineifilaceae bacterium]|nr:carbamoyltransferase C-terminal domain-containing protein [Candidatus Promineifilaceae bacterium]
MIVLGLTHPISWNNAACILMDGQLVAMAEEERFTRTKHAPRTPPAQAMHFCLQAAGVTLREVDYVAIGFDSAARAAMGNLSLSHGLSGLNQAAQWFREGRKHERLLPLDGVDEEKVIFVNHHRSHAASAFFASGFEEATILSLDGSGGSESGILAVGRGTEIEILHRVSNKGSWGLAYELITEALGFRRHSGEGKTMGLAAYGNPDPDGLPFVEWDGIPQINARGRQEFIASLVPRSEDAPLTDEHKQLAATLQHTLEQAGIQMAQWLYEQTGLRNLCLAGGTALNCSMNGKLALLPFVDNIFIQPAAHDAGTALGAALLVHTEKTGERPRWEMKHTYWGAEYGNAEIEAALQATQDIEYHLSDDVCREAAGLLADGKIVGWFQGRFEVGPRALGNRSILADPSNPDMKDLINMKVKNREPWRPFAPSVLEEEIGRYISPALPSPFMIQAFDVRPEHQRELVSATHVDNSARPQTVSRATNPRYWQLIKNFQERTGIPAVLNTSFNVRGQPIVNTPRQAIDTYLKTGMDRLAIGDFIVRRQQEQ